MKVVGMLPGIANYASSRFAQYLPFYYNFIFFLVYWTILKLSRKKFLKKYSAYRIYFSLSFDFSSNSDSDNDSDYSGDLPVLPALIPTTPDKNEKQKSATVEVETD